MKKDKKIGTLPSLMSASADAVPAIFKKDMALVDNQQEVVAHTAACLFVCTCSSPALHLWVQSPFSGATQDRRRLHDLVGVQALLVLMRIYPATELKLCLLARFCPRGPARRCQTS